MAVLTDNQAFILKLLHGRRLYLQKVESRWVLRALELCQITHAPDLAEAEVQPLIDQDFLRLQSHAEGVGYFMAEM